MRSDRSGGISRATALAGRALAPVALLIATMPGCDPPVPGPIGGIVLLIRTEPASTAPFSEIARIEIDYERIEAVVRAPDGGRRHTVVDSEVRSVVLENIETDVFIAQLQIPVGDLEQLRFFPRRVELVLRDGTRIELPPDTSALPSWAQTGWKLVPADGTPFPIVENELIGVRGLFDFDERPVHLGSSSAAQGRWKLKPTLPAERFEPNPVDGEPGLYLDRLLVLFREGTSRARVDEINAEIGANVLLAPVLSNAYRIRIPVTQNLETATDYYDRQPEVVTVVPAVDFALRQLIPTEGAQPNHDLSRFPFAWELADARGGRVGSHEVSVAVIDTGIDVTHPDIRLNMAINQGELPPGLFGSPPDIAAHDCDPDGVITMRDLECDDSIRPADISYGDPAVLDALDVLNDMGGWIDGDDGDDPNVFADDIFGWNFVERTRFIQATGPNDVHGTYVAGLIGAPGDASAGIAGASWRVSITSLVVASGTRSDIPIQAMPDHTVVEALRYAELDDRFHIAAFAGGWTFVRHGPHFPGANCGRAAEVTEKIPNEYFNRGVLRWSAFFATEFPDLTLSSTLYVLAAPNNGFAIDDFDTFDVPFEAMRGSPQIGDALLYVGAALEAGEKYPWSAYVRDPTGSRGGDGEDEIQMVYAPGVNWTSLLRTGAVCRAVGGVAGPRTCNEQLCEGGDAQTCSIDVPCSLEDDTEVCVATGTSFAAATVAGAVALLLSDTTRLRGDPVALRAAILAAAPLDPTFVTCGGESYSGGILDVERLLADNAP